MKKSISNLKGFTLIELLVAIAIIGILAFGASQINFNRLSDKQRALIFTNDILTNIESIRNNSLLGKAILPGLSSPGKVIIKLSTSNSGSVIINYYSGSSIVLSQSGANMSKFYSISDLICYSSDLSLSGSKTDVDLTIEGSSLSLSGCDILSTSGAILEIKTGYKNFQDTVRINAISGIIEKPLSYVVNVSPTTPIVTLPPATPTCSSFTYSAWGACQPDSTQTRTILTSSPSGCSGGSPDISQSCTYSTGSTFLANCSSNGQIIYADSDGYQIGEVDNAGNTLSGNPNSLTCAGHIMVCAGSGSGYVLQACNVGATTVYTNQTFTSTTTVRDSTVNSWAGGLYQWGNNADISYAGTSSSQVNTALYGPGNYYTLTTFRTGNANWSSIQNDNLWGSGGTVLQRQGACQSGYHIPTGGASGEWQAIHNAGGWSSISPNKGVALKNSLKLPFAGYRNRLTMSPTDQSTTAYYWSTTPSTGNAYGFGVLNSSIQPTDRYDRAYGFSLRCIKN